MVELGLERGQPLCEVCVLSAATAPNREVDLQEVERKHDAFNQEKQESTLRASWKRQGLEIALSSLRQDT